MQSGIIFAIDYRDASTQIRLHRAGQLHGQWLAAPIRGLAEADPDPAFRDAILLDIVLFLTLEANANAAIQQRLIIKGAAWVIG